MEWWSNRLSQSECVEYWFKFSYSRRRYFHGEYCFGRNLFLYKNGANQSLWMNVVNCSMFQNYQLLNNQKLWPKHSKAWTESVGCLQPLYLVYNKLEQIYDLQIKYLAQKKNNSVSFSGHLIYAVNIGIIFLFYRSIDCRLNIKFSETFDVIDAVINDLIKFFNILDIHFKLN